MASRTPLATLNAGHVLTAANVNTLPRGEIAYVNVTSDQGSITTEADVTSLTITATLSASRRYRWTYRGEFLSTVADGAYTAKLTDGSNTQLRRATGPADTASQSLGIVYEENGGGSSVTRKVRLERTTGTGTYTHGASATNPASLTLEDIGPAFT